MLSIDPTTNKPIIPLDASSLKHSYCMRHLYLDVIGGYNPKGGLDISLIFGNAVHKFAEAFYNSCGNEVSALLTARNYWKDADAMNARASKHKEFLKDPTLLHNVCLKVADYIAQDRFELVMGEDGPLVEQKFAITLAEYDDAIVKLYGTLDKIGQFGSRGAYGIGDWKTTTFYDTDKYFEGYRLDLQLPTYLYAIKHFALQYPDSIWAKMYEQGVRCFIDAVVVLKGKDPYVIRSEAFEFRERDLDMIAEDLREKAERIYLTWAERNVELPHPEGRFNGTCRTMYGNCKYFGVCSMPDAQSEIQYLSNKFVAGNYDPMSFR